MNAKEHILVIRLSAMGDVAMTVPVLLALSKNYPHLKITVLTRAFFAPMFNNIPNVSVFNADVKGNHKGIFGLWKLYRSLIKLNITKVADLHNVLRSKILKQFFRFSGIPFVQLDKGRDEKRALTAATNKHFVQLKTTHQRYADVFEKLGYPFTLTADSVLGKVRLTAEMENIVGKHTTKKWIGIAPFAAFEGKAYPLEMLSEVMADLKDKSDVQLFLFGGGEVEKRKLMQFESENCINMIGRLSFKEELALLSNLDLMLAMDSGNAHMAAMYGVPTITLWGVTHPYAGFIPFGQQLNTLVADREIYPLVPTSVYGNKAPDGYIKAITSIPPVTIVEKINGIFKAS